MASSFKYNEIINKLISRLRHEIDIFISAKLRSQLQGFPNNASVHTVGLHMSYRHLSNGRWPYKLACYRNKATEVILACMLLHFISPRYYESRTLGTA